MNWMSFYRPNLPIAIFMVDADGNDCECIDIAPEAGPLFMTLARLPLRDEAVPGGMLVPVSALLESGLFGNYSELLSRYERARIVLNDAQISSAPSAEVH